VLEHRKNSSNNEKKLDGLCREVGVISTESSKVWKDQSAASLMGLVKVTGFEK